MRILECLGTTGTKGAFAGMTALMAERIRMIVDTDEMMRRAVQLRRLKMPTGTTVSDVVNHILREALAEELAEVATYPGMEGEEGYKPKKRGRPRKKGGE
jgi:hypothetical protein